MNNFERDIERTKIWLDWLFRLSSDEEELRKQLEKVFVPLSETEEDEIEEDETWEDEKLYLSHPIYYDVEKPHKDE